MICCSLDLQVGCAAEAEPNHLAVTTFKDRPARAVEDIQSPRRHFAIAIDQSIPT
jgi:hypothetical protein